MSLLARRTARVVWLAAVAVRAVLHRQLSSRIRSGRPRPAVAGYPLLAGSSRSGPQVRRRKAALQRPAAARFRSSGRAAACGRRLSAAWRRSAAAELHTAVIEAISAT